MSAIHSYIPLQAKNLVAQLVPPSVSNGNIQNSNPPSPIVTIELSNFKKKKIIAASLADEEPYKWLNLSLIYIIFVVSHLASPTNLLKSSLEFTN